MSTMHGKLKSTAFSRASRLVIVFMHRSVQRDVVCPLSSGLSISNNPGEQSASYGS